MPFDPTSAVLVAPDAPEQSVKFDSGTASPVDSDRPAEKTDPLHLNEKEFMAASPLERLKMMLSHPWDKYVASVDQAFQGPKIPRVTAPTGSGAVNRAEQVGAAATNVGSTVASGIVSPGAIVSAIQPTTLLYSAPRFIEGGIENIIDAVKGVVSGKSGLQETAEKTIGGTLMLAGGAHTLARAPGAIPSRAGLDSPVAPTSPEQAITSIKEEASKLPEDSEAKAALDAAAVKISEASAKARFDPETAQPIGESNANTIQSPVEKIRGGPEAEAPPQEVAEGTAGEIQEPAGAPQELSPEVARKDFEDYQAIQADWKAELEKNGGDLGSPKIQELWKQNEAIKNRNGGMPPEPPKPPEIFDAATAEPVNNTPGFVTGIKNAVVDQERAARGKEALMSVGRMANPQAWDEAMQRIEQDPKLPQRIIDDLTVKPRALDPVESAVLIHEKVTRQNEFEKAVGDLSKAKESGDVAALELARQKTAETEADLTRIDEVARREGTFAGQSLQARKILADDDYSLASLAAKKIAAKGGERLTEEELVDLKKTSDQLKETSVALENQHRKFSEAARTDLESPQVKTLIQRILGALDKQADAAEQRLLSGRVNSISPQVLYDLSVIAARDIAHGAVDFTKWSAEKIERFGENVRPALEDAWKRGSEMLDQQVNKVGGKKRPSGAGRLGAYKTRVKNEISSLQDRIEAGDFSKLPRKPLELDAEAMKLREQREALLRKFKEGLERDKEAQLSKVEKATHALVKWRRAVVLSSVKVFPKLIEAGLIRVLVNPVGRALGQPLRLIPGLTEKAPYELAVSAKSEAANIAAIITSPPKMLAKLLTGKTDIDLKEGAKEKPPTEMLNFVGNAHGAIKEPVRQGAFAQSVALRLQELDKAGIDIREPDIQSAVISSAVADANRQIFLQDNIVTKYLIRLPLRALENQGAGGKALANTIKFLMPIVNVPTNIAIHQMRLIPPIGFGEAALRIVRASERGELKDHAAKLSEEDARNISIAFKAGMLGTTLAAYAWLNPDKFGGSYDQKIKNPNLKSGEIEIFGHVLPSWMNHAPELNFLSTVASSRRVFDRYYGKQPGDTVADILAFMIWAPVKDLPFISEPLRLFDSRKSPGQRAGALLRDATIPSAVISILDLGDDKTRKPKTFSDELKLAIPGLREEVRGVQKKK